MVEWRGQAPGCSNVSDDEAMPDTPQQLGNFLGIFQIFPDAAALCRDVTCQPIEEAETMINVRAIDELATRLATLVPPGMDSARDDLARTFRATLQSSLERLNLVTREEFDVQRLVLLRTREKLESLEKQLAHIEFEMASSKPRS
jgi:ubiquinone biosynthesis accessory factor UbiK